MTIKPNHLITGIVTRISSLTIITTAIMIFSSIVTSFHISRPTRLKKSIPIHPFTKHLTKTKSSTSSLNTLKTTRYTLDNEPKYPAADKEVLQKLTSKYYNKIDSFLHNKPISNHTTYAFRHVNQYIMNNVNVDNIYKGIILDSGCGTGRSSIILAKQHPECIVVGIDRSISRLNRTTYYSDTRIGSDGQDDTSSFIITFESIPNVLLVRAELVDFWRCILLEQNNTLWNNIHKHYMLYPNPYPKIRRLKNRWYANPSLPILLSLGCNSLVLRSNWLLYLQEFSFVMDYVNRKEYGGYRYDIGQVKNIVWDDGGICMTNFEQKYKDCGESVYEIQFHQM